ncbi:MFS transporter [Lacticigenium naphthae]|uniref:MFS transporter n=1 Tax=Lacticigenium naphthae TaxID=515351 RepID=UPI0003F4BEB1|nr:MFS transporter [Lacticigenium naphthae]
MGEIARNKSWKHWIVILSLCGLTASAIGLPVMSSGVFITPVSEDLGVLRGSFSIHNTLTLAAAAVVALYIPALLRRYKFKHLVLIGGLMGAFSTIGFGFSDSLWAFNILGIIRGIGTGVYAIIPSTMIINEWFEEKHGLATSIVLSFSGVAGAIFSPVFASLIISIGWQTTYMIMGVVIFVLCLPVILIPFEMSPREEGLLPYGYVPEVEEDERNNVSATEATSGELSKKADINWKHFGLLSLFAIMQTIVTGTPQHFPGFAETLQHSVQVGASMLSAAMLGNIFFKLSLGFISDYIGPIKATLSMLVLNLLVSILLVMVQAPYLLIAGGFLFGGAYSIPSVGIALLVNEYFDRLNFARLYPLISFAISMGGAFSLSIVGFIYDFTGSYTNAFLMGVGINAVNIVILFLVTHLVNKRAREEEAPTVETD